MTDSKQQPSDQPKKVSPTLAKVREEFNDRRFLARFGKTGKRSGLPPDHPRIRWARGLSNMTETKRLMRRQPDNPRNLMRLQRLYEIAAELAELLPLLAADPVYGGRMFVLLNRKPTYIKSRGIDSSLNLIQGFAIARKENNKDLEPRPPITGTFTDPFQTQPTET